MCVKLSGREILSSKKKYENRAYAYAAIRHRVICSGVAIVNVCIQMCVCVCIHMCVCVSVCPCVGMCLSHCLGGQRSKDYACYDSADSQVLEFLGYEGG